MNTLKGEVTRWPSHEVAHMELGDFATGPEDWAHLATRCESANPVDGLRMGATIWVMRQEIVRAAIAWEWAEMRPGVLVLADPNSLVSNITFVGAPSPLKALDVESQKRLMLNMIVHGLPWQSAVLVELRSGNRTASFWS